MNRRDFITVMGGATAASVLSIHPAFAAGTATTSLYVKGLVMVSFEDPHVLQLGFPKAPGHKGTLSIVPEKGNSHVLNIKGNGILESKAAAAPRHDFVIPELIQMKEIYGSSLRSRISECPQVIRIPYGAIRSIAADELSSTRYTFVRADNGEEVESFRARQIAESIKIELSSGGVLKLDGGKTSVALDGIHELRADYSPDPEMAALHSGDVFADHFHYYYAYMDRIGAANFDVVPKKLGGSAGLTPRVGNSFFPPYSFCFMVEI